ncbi:hypothetical protein [Legionella brunensis]|uniref:Substrate of the Dot/Icm secretion system n=1 Tax=Legionella brunensis TaxID=29422 RepID=A0A0W0SL82_9GAMM|nr:hypothetical protein [Legionella brunensis]KTC84183.1 substrate of the Dot/Icm secretion system [Legionella brunensis]
MGYIPPEYQELQKKTDTLITTFNNLSRRYIPAKYDELRKKVGGLEGKYNEKAPKKSGFFISTNKELRRDQTACINQLLPKLPTEGTPTILNQSQNVLLGAIFYRYKRLDNSYSQPYAFFGYNAKNSCTLFQVLEEEFKLDKLDDETLATCCEAYKTYLEQPDLTVENKTVGDQFPYIQEDPDFYINLKEIIVTARQKALPITRQLHVISFVESVAQSLRETDKAIADILPKFSKMVIGKFTKESFLTRDNLLELINSFQPTMSETSKEILKLSLPERVLPQGVPIPSSEMTRYIGFQDYLSQALTINSTYTLLGAYVMALGRCNSHTPKLKDVLNSGINSMVENLLDDTAKELSLTAFKNYVEIPGRPQLNCKAWSDDTGEEHMKMDLDIRHNKLKQVSEVLAF